MPKDQPREEKNATLHIQRSANGGYEVCDENCVLHKASDEAVAIWGAVMVAEEMARSGRTVRVVARRGGDEVDEFVAKPRGRYLSSL